PGAADRRGGGLGALQRELRGRRHQRGRAGSRPDVLPPHGPVLPVRDPGGRGVLLLVLDAPGRRGARDVRVPRRARGAEEARGEALMAMGEPGPTPRAAWLARGLWLAVVAGVTFSLVVLFQSGHVAHRFVSDADGGTQLLSLIFATVGAVIASKQPR